MKDDGINLEIDKMLGTYVNARTQITDMKRGYNDVTEFEEKAMNLNNLFTREQIDTNRFTRFARYGIIDPYFSNMYSREYLFFTKPDLNIFNKDGSLNTALVNNNYFTGAVYTNRRSLECLQDTYILNSKNKPRTWNFLLSNQVSSNLDMPSMTAEMSQHNQNLYGISQSFRDSSRSSEYSFDFNLEFTDTVNHDVYHFFKGFNEYCNLEYERDLLPHEKYLSYPNRYKEFSIYKIVVNDYNKIIYYGKHIGVTIRGLPTDAMNEHEGITKFSIPMHSFHVVDFNPYILTEINILSERAAGKFYRDPAQLEKQCLPLYDKEYNTANKEWASVPFIQAVEVDTNKYEYYLKWRKIDG